MVYREAPEHTEPAEPEGDVLLRADASGRAGARGHDGHAGADGAGAGRDGGPAGHAGAASAGESGGVVRVTLEEDGYGAARVRGSRRLASGAQSAIDARVEIGDWGFVDLLARGGAGGPGGDGGRGGDGARGSRGRDATRYSSGGNGGRGGDGGPGGRGSSGADGGPGGEVVVEVAEADTHLLMLVRQGVEGGAGGAHGSHGSGGAAGPGGAGGSSHSWTETEHYTDSQGKRRTRTRHHRNPGGHGGASGRRGPDGSGPLASGRGGQDGRFTIEVRAGDGSVARYGSRYHLLLTGLRLATDDRDEVFEPGEIVRVSSIRVRNAGGMPTPSTRAITIEARESRWCVPLRGQRGESLEVPRSVPAGEEVEVPGTLSFALRDHAPVDPSDPLCERERLSLRAEVPDVQRAFDPFELQAPAEHATMTVRFPIAASVLQGLVALAPGEVTRLRFVIRNQSSKTLGEGGESKRRVRLRVALSDSEIGDEGAVFADEHGAVCALGGQGFTREIERLAPGEDRLFETALGLRGGAPAYRALRVRLTLEIGRLEEPDVLRAVQHRELHVRCVRPLAPALEIDWLLVASHRTSRGEIEAWEALAARLERRLVVWDLSLHGHLDLGAPRDDGPALLDRMKGGLVIVLGAPMTTPSGPVRPDRFASPRTLALAADAGVDVLFAGGEPDLAALRAPFDLRGEASGVAPARGEGALVERILARVAREGGDRAFVEHAELEEIGLAFEGPRPERLEARAKRLAARLCARVPSRRFVVVWTAAPEARAHYGLLKRYRLGTLRVLAGPSASGGCAHAAWPDEALADPALVRSSEALLALAAASGPEDQLDGLARAIEAGDVEAARVWADALAAGLASEQLAVLRSTRARAGLSRRALRASLPRLARFAQASLLGASAVESMQGEQIAELAARVLFFARAQARWWERVWGVSWLRRAPAMDAVARAAVRAFVQAQSSDQEARERLRERIDEALAALERSCREAEREEQGAFARSVWAEGSMLDPLARAGVESGDALLVTDCGTVLASDQHEARASVLRAIDEERAQLAAGVEQERRALLLDVRAGELAGAAVAEPDEEQEHALGRPAATAARPMSEG